MSGLWKRCGKCGSRKKVDKFYSGLNMYCKKCCKEYENKRKRRGEGADKYLQDLKDLSEETRRKLQEDCRYMLTVKHNKIILDLNDRHIAEVMKFQQDYEIALGKIRRLRERLRKKG